MYVMYGYARLTPLNTVSMTMTSLKADNAESKNETDVFRFACVNDSLNADG